MTSLWYTQDAHARQPTLNDIYVQHGLDSSWANMSFLLLVTPQNGFDNDYDICVIGISAATSC